MIPAFACVIVANYSKFDIESFLFSRGRNRQIANNNKMKAPLARELSPVSCMFLLRLFPFGVMINKDMRVLGAGDKLLQAWGGTSSILNKPVAEIFKLRRPKGISFTWGNVSRSY